MSEKTLEIVYKHYRIPESLLGLRNRIAGKPKGSTLFRYGRSNGWHRKDFSMKPHPKGGETICQLYDVKTGAYLISGHAMCSLSDNFCYETGRLLSVGRALQKLGKHIESLPVV